MHIKKLILLTTFVVASTIGVSSEISNSELISDQENVQLWISLIQDAEKHYIDMSVYPEEIQHYQIHMIKILEQYMAKIEHAEITYYDGGDYKSAIHEAKNILNKIGKLKQMFDDYVHYTKSEKSTTYLDLTRKALAEQKALPRMHFIAYTVYRGEYPVTVDTIKSPLPFVKKIKVTYENGDVVYFTNDKLIAEEIIK